MSYYNDDDYYEDGGDNRYDQEGYEAINYGNGEEIDEGELREVTFEDFEGLLDLDNNESKEGYQDEKQEFSVPYAQLAQLGGPRALGVEEDLSLMVDDKYKRLSKLSKTNEQIFNVLAIKAKERLNLTNDNLNDTLRMIGIINNRNRELRYKNPTAIMLALCCLTNNKIDKKKLNNVYEKYGKSENMTKADILRYCFFILDITT